MLRRLSSSLQTFKTLEYHAGLNILVADKTKVSVDTDTRNGSGKSSMVELLHFLLGSRADKSSLPMKPELVGDTFELELDWPGADGVQRLSALRRGTSRERVILRGSALPETDAGLFGNLFNELDISNPEWQSMIEAALFSLTGEHPCVSGRSMLAYYMRRASAFAFNTATRNHPQQSSADSAGNLCYLFGFNWHIASEYREISERETLRRKLRQAAKDPMLGRIVGNAAELRSQIAIAGQRTRMLEQQLATFQVVPEYERLKAEADELTAQIRVETDNDVMDRQNLRQLEEAITEETPPNSDYVERVYAELRVDIPDAVRQSYENVRHFHDSVIRNRRYYLETEIQEIRQRIDLRQEALNRLDARRAEVMRTLSSGGALTAFLELQKSLTREQSALETLRNRWDASEALEATDRQIKASRIGLQERMSADLSEREAAVALATVAYAEYAHALYGDDRTAYLVISADESGVKFSPHIESDESQGIGSMVTFCFDLTMAMIAHRGGRGPDFLVHDSHLFDGVDARQVARALQLGSRVADAEGMQYIVTINSDDLNKTVDYGFDPFQYVLPVRLTDAYDDGGLFGFRFP